MKLDDPFITIDLHGMRQDEARNAIDKALQNVSPHTYQLRLVHGFHRGTNLRTMIYDWYRYESKVLRITPGDNPGITVLVLKEQF